MTRKVVVVVLLIIILVPLLYVAYADIPISSQNINNVTDNVTDEINNNPVREEQNININTSMPDASYEINISEDGGADLSLAYRRISNDSYRKFKERQLIPYDSFNLLSVSDTKGELKYSVDDNRITYESVSDVSRNVAYFNLEYTADIKEEDQFSDSLKQYTVKTSGSEGREQRIRINSENRILSLYTSTKHRYNMSDNYTTVMGGSGPMTTRVLAGNPDNIVENVAIFDESDEVDNVPYDKIDQGYSSAVSSMGIERENVLYPLVILDEGEFNSEFSGETQVSGTYRNGVIYIPSNVLSGDTSRSIIAHEITHALNGQVTPYFPDWFDEGTAMMTQISTADRYNEPYSYPFSDKSSDVCGGQRCVFTNSQDDSSSLIDYIESNRSYMSEQQWSESSSFRYAYSSLVINDVVRKTENTSMVSVYQTLIDDRSRIHDNQNRGNMTSIMLENLELQSLNPCSDFYEDTVSEDDIRNCVKINNEVLGYPDGFSNRTLIYRFDIEYKEVGK